METSAEQYPQPPSEAPVAGGAPARRSAPKERFRLSDLRRSERILGACAAVLLVSGLLLQAYGAMRGAAPSDERSARLVAENGSRSGGGSRTLQPGASLVDQRGSGREPAGTPSSTQRSEESSGDDGLIEEWSPAMVRGGFGFFVGFAVGLVLRIFFRVSVVIIGLNLLMLFVFSYVGWLEVRWDTIEIQMSEWMLRLQEEFAEFKTFIAGSLPTVGLSGAGLFTGFRKR